MQNNMLQMFFIKVYAIMTIHNSDHNSAVYINFN